MKTMLSPEEVVQQGKAVYERDIKALVEADPANYAQMLVLDINTGEYEIGPDVWQAVNQLKKRLPDAEPFTVRVGFPSAFRIGGGAYRGELKTNERVVMAQKVRLHDADRSFDVAFWQAQSSSARFDAVWEMVVHAHRPRGENPQEPHELPLQRTVARRIKRKP